MKEYQPSTSAFPSKSIAEEQSGAEIELFKKKPELRNNEYVLWSENGAGEMFQTLCGIMKGNGIPVKFLTISCNCHQYFFI